MSEEILLHGRVAVITGAGRGIGRAHALLLARLGAALIVNDRGGGVEPGSQGSPAPADEVVGEVRAAGGRAVASYDDISTPAGARAAVEAAIDHFGRVDCVINNAGTSVHKPFEAVTPDELDAMLRVHIGGHFHVTQAAWPHFARQDYGRVVMTTSGSGLFGSSHNHHYAAAKGGIVGLTRSLAVDGEKLGIRVNAIAPIAATRLIDNVENQRLKTALRDHVRPDQIAPLVAWLASELCDINGQILEVGGGMISRIFIAESRGYFDPSHGPADVAANRDAWMDIADFRVPTFAEETAIALLERIGIAL